MEEEELLKRHLLDLARQAEIRDQYTFSGFLGLFEQDVLLKLKPELAGTKVHTFGGSEASERVIAVFGAEETIGKPPVYPIAVLALTPETEKYAEPLSHRDYLGAILSLGIERSLVGDIVIRGKKAWVFCLESAAAFIRENLLTVRHNNVAVELLGSVNDPAIKDLPELKPELKEVSVNVASERLDAIVASYINVSRNKATELFTQQRVSVNGKIVTNLSMKPKEGDTITVRGFGKAIYEGINGHSKKGRLYVTLKKYV